MNKQEKNNLAKAEGFLSIVVNVLLFGLKYWAGVVSGSIALMADAWHTLSDSLSSLVLLIGIKQSQAEPDEKHPYGHERYEVVASIIIGVMLGSIAFDFLIDSIKKFASDEEVKFGIVAIAVTIASIVFKEALARFSFWATKKTNLSVLKAEAWHHRSDAISSLVILIGIFTKPFIPVIDQLLGIAVSCLLFHAAYEVISDAIKPLIGSSAPDDLIGSVTEICKKHVGDQCGAHHFHIHEYGSHIELTFHIRLKKDMTVKEAHDHVTAIEREVKQKHQIFATIHAEPLHE